MVILVFIKKFFYLSKPGIVFSNLLTAFTGVALACFGVFDWTLLFFTLFGLVLILSSATAFNNYIDSDIDILVDRTKNRVSVNGSLSGFSIISFAITCGIIGFLILWFFVNPLTSVVSFVGFIVYTVLYSMILKRTSVYSTLVGSVSGAVLPLAGYVSVTGKIDISGIILFFVLLIWQMPHFYAIGIYRLDDYTKANIPIMPVRYSIEITKIHIMIWTVLFSLIILIPYFFGILGLWYLFPSILIGMVWNFVSYKGFFAKDNIRWAKSVFLTSIVVLLAWCSNVIINVLI